MLKTEKKEMWLEGNLAALALQAKHSMIGFVGDIDDNLAERTSDGDVLLCIKDKKKGGHKRVILRCPSTISFEVVDAS